MVGDPPPRSTFVPLAWTTLTLGLLLFVAYGSRARFATEVNVLANRIALWWWDLW